MMLPAWSPSGTILKCHHQCVLSQVNPDPDITVDITKTKNNHKETNHYNNLTSSPNSLSTLDG